MSHVAHCELQIKDLPSLKKAAELLGLEFKQDQKTYRWFGRYMADYSGTDAAFHAGFKPEDYGKCEHALAVKDDPKAYEVGVVHRKDGKPGYALLFDFWQGGYGLMERIGPNANKLKVEYGVAVATKRLKAQGKTVQRKVVNNKVVLYAS